MDIDITLDNTGAVCYSNPYQLPSDSFFVWLGPDPSSGSTGMYAYTMYVPEGQPKPECDSNGVCNPCDALNPIRGNNPAEWSVPNSTLIEEFDYGYSIAKTQHDSGCGTNMLTYASEDLPYNNDVCGPFQGNVTVERGNPNSCANRNITTAMKCGAKCDKRGGLERAVYMNDESGEPACCVCKYSTVWIESACDSGKDAMCFKGMSSSSGSYPRARIFFGTTVLFMLLLW